MTPDLLKALYAAGFPCTTPNGTKPVAVLSHDPHEVSTNLYEPSLEELIEACGDGFVSLTKMGMNHSNSWRTESSEITFYDATTAVESVAALWLALNEKKV